MANECETSIVFYSEHKALIKDLWQNIIDFCKDNQDCTIYKFMLKRGYSQNDYFLYLHTFGVKNGGYEKSIHVPRSGA